jgi:hypothetical protein
VRDDANLVPINLIVSPAGVFGSGGSQPVGLFGLRGLAAATAALAQFTLVFAKVVVDAIELALQALLLPGADFRQIIG